MSPQQLLGQIVLNVIPGPDGVPQVQVNCSPNMTHHEAIGHLLTGANAVAALLVAPMAQAQRVEPATESQVPPAPAFAGKNRINGKV